MSTFVIYHANCYDGFGAAWAAHRYFKPRGIETTYLPGTYGKPIPEVPADADVLMVDVSWKRTEMYALALRVKSLVVLDHHKTALEELKDFPGTLFDMKKSGAVLTWEYLFPQKPVPSLLTYVQDADLWQWKLPYSKEIVAWIRSYPREVEVWDRLAEEIGSAAISEGTAILRFQNQKVEEIADQATCLSWDEYGKIPVVNTSCLMSEVANKLLERFPASPFSAYWFDRPDGQRQFGLRSREGFDCSVVAKGYGGGGHAQASGFTVDPEVWMSAGPTAQP